jgi:hypothetical protein
VADRLTEQCLQVACILNITQRQIWLVVASGLVLLALLAIFLLNGPLSWGTAQSWSHQRGCWPRPAAY